MGAHFSTSSCKGTCRLALGCLLALVAGLLCGCSSIGPPGKAPGGSAFVSKASDILNRLQTGQNKLSDLSIQAAGKPDLIGDGSWRGQVQDVAAGFDQAAADAKVLQAPADCQEIQPLVAQVADQYVVAGKAFTDAMINMNESQTGQSTRELSKAMDMLQHARNKLRDLGG